MLLFFYSGEKDAIGDKKEKDKKKGEYYAALQLEGFQPDQRTLIKSNYKTKFVVRLSLFLSLISFYL